MPDDCQKMVMRFSSNQSNYFISSFLFSLDICKTSKYYCTFLVEFKSTKKRYPFGNMRELCLPKDEDRFKFCMIHEFNLDFLAKQLWRLVQFQDSLLTRVLGGKHYRLSSPLRINSTNNLS